MAAEIYHLSFEHHRQPFGIGEACPRLSWMFSGDVKDWEQKSYELSILRNGTLEEHFTVESSASVLVPWPSTPLKSGESAAVRVRALGGNDRLPTEWSTCQNVEAGLLHVDDWRCALIESPILTEAGKPHRPVLFRRSFTATKKIQRARLYITAHGVYEAEINGQRVGDHVLAPGWTSYDHRLLYQTFDVTNLLDAGENVIGAEVGEGWYAGRLGFLGGKRNIWGSVLGLICQLAITYDDGTVENIGSDAEWRCNTGAIVTSEIYDGEVYDARLEKRGWSRSDFDASSWLPAGVSSDVRIFETLASPDAPPVRRIEELPALHVSRSPKGKIVVDFGQNLVGRLRVHVRGELGRKISFTHTEVLEHGECATRPLRCAAAKDTVTLSGSHMKYEPKFTFHGFRYVEVDNWPSEDGMPDLKDLTAIVLHTDMERTGWFECSDPLLNKLHENITWGMRGNFLSIPTDCPQRDERLGWTGDIQAFAPTATFLFNSNGMLYSWLKDLASEQLANGGSVPPLVCPNVLGEGGKSPNALWSDCVISTPWDVYQASGDLEILKAQYESMQKWIDFGLPRDSRGLWDTENAPQLGDWLDPAAPPDDPGNGRTDSSLVANAFLYGMTVLMSKISSRLRLPADSTRYRDAAAVIKQRFADEYITRSGRVVSDSQTSLALAIHFSLFPTAAQALTASKRLAHLIRASARFKIATGFAGTPVLGPALTRAGLTPLFYRMLLHRRPPSWLYAVAMGATTVWERWDGVLPDGTINPGEMTSFNHYALGSVAHWMHAVVGGLAVGLRPGWRRFVVRPIPGGALSRARVSYRSPYGLIAVEWWILGAAGAGAGAGEVFRLEVVVPPNATARVCLPSCASGSGIDSGSGIESEGWGEDESERAGMEADVGLVVGSGTWRFEERYERPEWPPLPIYPPFYPHDDDEP